jgi:hypothetical protein
MKKLLKPISMILLFVSGFLASSIGAPEAYVLAGTASIGGALACASFYND